MRHSEFFKAQKFFWFGSFKALIFLMNQRFAMSCYRWKCQWLSDFSTKYPDGILSQSTCLFKTVLERLSLSDTVFIYIIPQLARIVFSSTELALLRRGFSNLKCPQTITLQINVATSQTSWSGFACRPDSTECGYKLWSLFAKVQCCELP